MRKKLSFSILLGLFALVSVTAATVAWFSIADFTKLYSMSMEITSGINLRFDIDPHDTFEEYTKTLSFQQISERMEREKGHRIEDAVLTPVTTSDGTTFSLEDGSIVTASEGAYLEYTLYFMATQDMYIHLTTENQSGKTDGTLISSSNPDLPRAMRVAFTVGEMTYIYNPSMAGGSKTKGKIKEFGLPNSENMVFSNDNAMFFLNKDESKQVIVKIWLEGTDPACTDALRKADYSIRLRFEGTDSENNKLEN